MARSKKKGKAKKRLDAFYDLAKREGYRARSAFKLIQLNRKYEILKNCSSVIDLCAAPGGWMQVAKQLMPPGGEVIGVDLAPIKGITGCKAILGDIYSDRTRKAIQNSLKNGKTDVVLHDGSPNVGGVWIQEVFAQHQLVLQALKISTEHLVTGGWFVTKVFRSENFTSLLWVFKQLFTKVEATKPLASRAESSEIYVICHGYKNPHRVDPRFFKLGDVFKETDEKSVTALQNSLDAGKSLDVTRNLHKRCKVSDFVNVPDATQLVGEISEITFDTNDELEKTLHDSTFTTKEILYICSDVKQASEADIKRLLRWRERFRKERERRESKARPAEKAVEAPPAEETTEDILAEIEGLRKNKLKQQKKKMRKIVDRKLKHLGKVIHHDPFVVENVDQSEGGHCMDDANRFTTNMPSDSDAHSDSSTNGDLNDEFEETIATTNRFHSNIRGMLSKQARLKSERIENQHEAPEAAVAQESAPEKAREANKALRSRKKVGDIVDKKLQADEANLVKRQKTCDERDLVLLEPQARAEILAMASEMLTPAHRESILEDAINRHTRGEEDLPEWFLQDEKKHYFRRKPISKAAIDYQKQRFEEINVRPCKKVAEAINRKRKKASKILRKVQKKGQTDPRMKEKGERMSIRSLMRSKTLNKIGTKPMDNKMKGELYRNRQRRKKK
ncbi:rRNA methyltransferase Spb1 [Perkinsela sp. CCAP 1560/4]|nr:rRNA methyltransferase Spb1 [Perkinsela sp. CCAP 1560/4]|eukprot:KNH09498.1 rRNA methyltransferase Spb1 [Perkinsela sp. CCAP 1560/4]